MRARLSRALPRDPSRRRRRRTDSGRARASGAARKVRVSGRRRSERRWQGGPGEVRDPLERGAGTGRACAPADVRNALSSAGAVGHGEAGDQLACVERHVAQRREAGRDGYGQDRRRRRPGPWAAARLRGPEGWAARKHGPEAMRLSTTRAQRDLVWSPLTAVERCGRAPDGARKGRERGGRLERPGRGGGADSPGRRCGTPCPSPVRGPACGPYRDCPAVVPRRTDHRPCARPPCRCGPGALARARWPGRREGPESARGCLACFRPPDDVELGAFGGFGVSGRGAGEVVGDDDGLGTALLE